MKNSLPYIALFLFLALFGPDARAQGEQKAIIFTGVVVAGKSTERLPGAYIFIPKAGRGTLTNNVGYFSIPVFPGDSIVYSYVGYKTQYHVVPRQYNAEGYSAIIAMQESVTMLAEVKVYPYATEEEFKRAFLELKLPDQADRDALARNTDINYLNRMAAQMPNNAQTNYRYTMDQQIFGRESAANKGFATTFPFLNPFAWSSFIKSVQNGDLKKKEYRKDLGETPRENMTRQDYIRK
ncbi:carboxypeptidase-like regulatory domain-containing protein [Arundinibacter roseus]|uniref:Carboxypeptidase-like regulatory domain-containing protein n=1 Tax=Arundinibacter roseus TaxID=2070510 RepID=A0A4R4JX20_9BACT|nr:carboxypeptidase-like regulatory domain-containing protein [Arundinibacter roseus]TDB58672.1 carboxypeptidase-like regulatory domain-containing protein [Arundinibacter roseus]